jgi:hypothetical protein
MPHGNAPFMAAENAKRCAARQAGSIFEVSGSFPSAPRPDRCPSATPSGKISPQPFSSFARRDEAWNEIHLLDSAPL